jgi:hypothetical protein
VPLTPADSRDAGLLRAMETLMGGRVPFRRYSRAYSVLAIVLLAGPLFGKRAAPPVAPAVHGGINYSAPNDDGRIGYVQASDSVGKHLFRIIVFQTEINPNLEEDVQWVFITDLKLAGDSLWVKDEKSRCYSVDLNTKAVEKKPGCGAFPAASN